MTVNLGKVFKYFALYLYAFIIKFKLNMIMFTSKFVLNLLIHSGYIYIYNYIRI